MASSLVDLSRNVIPVRVVNVGDKERVVKEGEVLATCAPVTCINRNLQATITLPSDTLINNILQCAELNTEKRSAAERLQIEFKDLFSKTSGYVGRTKEKQHRNDTRNNPPINQHPRRLHNGFGLDTNGFPPWISTAATSK